MGNQDGAPMTAMTPCEAAGRALHLIEHPNVDPSMWESLNPETRDAWITKARPVADAVLAVLT